MGKMPMLILMVPKFGRAGPIEVRSQLHMISE